MQANAALDHVASLLDAPSPAVLTVYRSDGSAVVSPVWFRRAGDSLEVVVASRDSKVAHLRRDPRCILVVFEAAAPFRGLEIRGVPEISTRGVREARLAISSRYIGPERARSFTERRGDDGVLLRLSLASARSWDLSAAIGPD